MSIETARTIGDDASEALQVAIAALMRRAADRFAPLVSTLDIGPDGRIVSSEANVGRVSTVLDGMRAVLFDETYMADVAIYLESLNQLSSAVSSGLREFGADEAVLRAIARRAKQEAAAALLDQASFRDLFGSISTQLINSIATSADAAAVTESVRKLVAG
jgi:hypothetical protein